jgi:hypothetical protein
MRRAALIALLALAPPSAPPARAADTHAHVACTDYVSGSYRRVSLDTRAPLACDVAIGGDPAIRWHGGRAWVINRFGGDNLQAIDPAACATVEQHSTGNGSNPQDAVFASETRVYVSRYETSDLVALDPDTGATLATIPLAAFADADGLPEMTQMARVGPLLFVALQRLDRDAGFTPADSSLVVVVDTRADTVLDVRPQTPGIQAIRLALTNPITAFQFDRATSRLLIGCAGVYGVNDGGVEWIDPVTLTSGGVAVSEAALGGDVSDLVWRDAQRSFAIVSDASFNTMLVSFRAADGTQTGTVWSPGGYVLADAALNDRDELWIANNGFAAPGLYVRDAATGASLAGPIDVGLPPREIAFDHDAAMADVGPRVVMLDWLGPVPNPARVSVRFALALAEPADVALEVIDIAGRRVRTLAHGPLAGGRHDMAWNLADDEGRTVAVGVYFARVTVGAHVATRRVVVTR